MERFKHESESLKKEISRWKSPQTKSQENKYFGERNRRNSSITSQAALMRKRNKRVIPVKEGGGDNIPKGEIDSMKVQRDGER